VRTPCSPCASPKCHRAEKGRGSLWPNLNREPTVHQVAALLNGCMSSGSESSSCRADLYKFASASVQCTKAGPGPNMFPPNICIRAPIRGWSDRCRTLALIPMLQHFGQQKPTGAVATLKSGIHSDGRDIHFLPANWQSGCHKPHSRPHGHVSWAASSISGYR
jgi:hypothetical protein